MILRRVIAHFRKQEWTAIAIDFVIVVMGVFIGIQVANWNAARAERAGEREFIETVRDSIADEAEDIRGYIAMLDESATFGARAAATLAAAEPCEGDCQPAITDFFLASQWVNVKGDRTAFDEVRRTGLPRDRSLKAVITRYYGLQDQLASIVTELPLYRERVRSIIPAAMQDYYWRNCFRVEGRKQYFVVDCRWPSNEDQSRAIVDALRADPEIRSALNYWLSTIGVVRVALAQQGVEADATVAAIDKYLGKTK